MIRQGPVQAGSVWTRPALSPAQWAIYEAGWNETARFRVAVCGRRFGKALALDTMLPGPGGWTRMGDVEPGTRLFDELGRVCVVTYATGIMLGRPCNTILFDDGGEITADDEHLWPVSVAGMPGTRLLTTRRIAIGLASGTRFRIPDRLPAGFTGERKVGFHAIRSIRPVDTTAVRCIQVDSPSRLYLCGRSLVATHNTFLMAEELRRAARLAVRENVGTENEIWYGAPNFLQAKRVMWGRLKRAIPRSWIDGAPSETSCSIRLRSGHVIRLVGLDASENLRGSGLWFFGGDEWADCRPSAWREVIRPMLSTSRGHALFIGTPKGFDHFRDAYILGQLGGDPSYRSFLFTTADGGQVPPEELQAAEKELDARVFRQEYGASFETYAGRVVYAFSRAENVRRSAHDPNRPLHVGMDFNVNPMSATVWQEDGETTRQIDEIILPTSNTDEMAEEIARRFGRDGFEPGRKMLDHITVYPDPAGAQRRSSAGGRTDIGILRERGFVVCALRSHPPVRDRLNVMNRHFRSADGTVLATVDPRCTRSIEAYERLVYKTGTNEPDKGLGFDHLVDASGYYLFGRRSVNSSATATSSFMER
ncbi:MAG: hypothetical protein ACRYGI_08470 [Janthinobacterium lividum]